METSRRSTEICISISSSSRKYSKSSKFQLYIIIMKPFIEVAGGNHLPAICYAQRGGMAYLRDYPYSKEHWQSNRQEGFAVLGKEAEG